MWISWLRRRNMCDGEFENSWVHIMWRKPMKAATRLTFCWNNEIVVQTDLPDLAGRKEKQNENPSATVFSAEEQKYAPCNWNVNILN